MICLCYYQISAILFTAVLTVPATVMRNENSQFMSKDDLKRVQNALVYETMNRRSEQILYPNTRSIRMTFDEVPIEQKDLSGFDLESGNTEAIFGPLKMSTMKRENGKVTDLELSENVPESVYEYENRLAQPKVGSSSAKDSAQFYKFINQILSRSLERVTGAIKRNQKNPMPAGCEKQQFGPLVHVCQQG